MAICGLGVRKSLQLYLEPMIKAFSDNKFYVLSLDQSNFDGHVSEQDNDTLIRIDNELADPNML